MPEYVNSLDITLLQPNPFQPRNKIKPAEVEELSQSIKEHGILEPLVVAETPAGYQIIAGERRWRAAKIAGLAKVPVVIKKVTPRQMLEMALIENVQRIDLNPLERAQAFQQLLREFNITVGEVAVRISKSGSYVSNSIRLLQLPDAIKDGISGNLISEGHARALAGITDPKAMIDAYKQLLVSRGSVRDAEEIVRMWRELNPTDATKSKRKNVTSVVDPEVKLWEDELKKVITSRSQVTSKIKLTRSQTQTRVVITLKGSQAETQKALEDFMGLTKPLSK
ncbi:ParB/RepB/Spo0J family partition protein [Candidatus Woesebacteria bacterium]|nr:ParB/RepB/Spo0J family partition protein [Candidatus Woesebacteria bacterium]